MTRLECEKQMLELAKKMADVYSQYAEKADDYVFITLKDGYISIQNNYYSNPTPLCITCERDGLITSRWLEVTNRKEAHL